MNSLKRTTRSNLLVRPVVRYAHSFWLPEMTFLSERVQHHCTTNYGKLLHVSFLCKVVKLLVSTRVRLGQQKPALTVSIILLNWERTCGSQNVKLCMSFGKALSCFNGLCEHSIFFLPLFYCLISQMFSGLSWNKVSSWPPHCCQNVLHRSLSVHHSKFRYVIKKVEPVSWS